MSTDIPPPPAPPRNDAIISYMLLRQFIGYLGLLTPILLPLGSYVIGGCTSLEPSISHYYYSIMHVAFMAVLCMLGSFLITYKGTSKRHRLENTVSNLAGLCAFCVAIFPTKFNHFCNEEHCRYIILVLKNGTDLPTWVNTLHHLFAAILFASFAVFCLVFFQDSDSGVYDIKKKRRNRLYKICAVLILISISTILFFTIFPKLDFQNSTFIFETTALIPFGLSWLVKGSGDWPCSKNVMLRKSIGYLR